MKTHYEISPLKLNTNKKKYSHQELKNRIADRKKRIRAAKNGSFII